MFGEEQSEKTDFEPLPGGDYNVIFNNVTADFTGNHPMLNAEFSVLRGDYKNRKLWKRFYFSDGTAKKFLPWQMSIFGIKSALDEMNLTSHKDTAEKALDLLGGMIGLTYVVNVSIVVADNGKKYNDLVLKQQGESTEADTQPKNHAPTMQAPPPTIDETEDFGF